MQRVPDLDIPIPDYKDIEHYEHLTLPDHFARSRKGRVDGRRVEIKWLMMHNTESINSLYWLTQHPTSGVSVHCLGTRTGKRRNLVNYADTAYHAGWCKPEVGNLSSLGYEAENLSASWRKVPEPYPDAQILMMAFTFAGWQYSYGLYSTSIVRHGDVAIWEPGHEPHPYFPRRTDPNFFPMGIFHEYREKYLKFFDQLPEPEVTKYLL